MMERGIFDEFLGCKVNLIVRYDFCSKPLYYTGLLEFVDSERVRVLDRFGQRHVFCIRYVVSARLVD